MVLRGAKIGNKYDLYVFDRKSHCKVAMAFPVFFQEDEQRKQPAQLINSTFLTSKDLSKPLGILN